MKTILIMLAVAMLASLPVSAQIPRLINYQGVLTDDMGVVVSDGSYNMIFRLYDVPSGGTHLWEETIAVNVSKGIFNTTLGHDPIIEEAFDKPLYLALEINGGGELSPRRIFTASAYAFSARALYGISNVFPADGNVGIGLMNPEAPLHIYTSIADATTPALLIQNTGNQSRIDFRMATVTEARIRHAAGSDFSLGTLTSGGVSLMTHDLTRLRIDGDGKVGIGIFGPLEKLDVTGAIRLGTTAGNNAGTIRWTGADFEGYDGSLWNSLTTGGGSGLPAGTSGQTLRHDGVDWTATGNLFNNGSYVGIGTTSPTSPLHVVQTAGQTGLQVDGNDASWASIYLNATGGGNPTYGYQRSNTLWGHHYIDASYNWNLILNSNPSLVVTPGGWAGLANVPILESLNIPGGLRLGTSGNSNAGTIRWTGTDFEGYDGGGWNSLTAGALPAGTANQTLRFDGGSWIASSNLTNTDSGVGIGTIAPTSDLHLRGLIPMERIESSSGAGYAAVELLTNGGTDDFLKMVKYGSVRSGTTAGGIPLAGLSQIYAGGTAGALMLQTGAMEPMYLVTGNARRMEITGDGDILTYSDINGALISMVYGWSSGYYFGMYDNAGNLSGTLESDSDTGGFMSLRRNATADGFLVNGNYMGLQGTRVDILGATTAITFDASAEGDDSVELPPDALSAPEILDEPGAGYDWRTAVYNLDTAITSVAARTITVPAAGYVIVWGTAEVQIDHTSGTADHGRLGVSADEIGFPSAQNNDLKLDALLATGVYTFPVTVHGLFEVADGGAFTYYLIGSEFSGVVSVNKSSLTALYIPTAYGAVDALSAPYGSASSDFDPALERREAEAFNDARLERELAAMRDRIAALESELGNK